MVVHGCVLVLKTIEKGVDAWIIGRVRRDSMGRVSSRSQCINGQSDVPLVGDMCWKTNSKHSNIPVNRQLPLVDLVHVDRSGIVDLVSSPVIH